MLYARQILLISLFSLFTACSSSNFASSSAKKSSKDGATDSGVDTDNDSDTVKKNNDGDGDSSHSDNNDLDTDIGIDGGDLTFDDFTDSDKKFQIDADNNVFERFVATESKSLVDIVFVIDTSGSMDDEINKVENALETFIQSLLDDPLLTTMHLFVLAGTDDQTFDPPANLNDDDNFAFIDKGHEVASRNLLGVARNFLAGDIPSPELKLRDGATTHFVFVTDDDPEAGKDADTDKNPPGIKSPTFEAAVDLDKVVVHGIVCQNSSGDCKAEGRAYSSLATKTGGIIENLTTNNWNPVLEAIANKVKDITKARFELSQSANGDVDVFVNGDKLDDSKFNFDGNAITILTKLNKDDVIIVKYKSDD